MEKKFLISAIVEDKPGVLQRIANLFTRRGFNIDTFSAGETVGQGLVRITVTLKGDEQTAEQLVKQLSKMIDVIYVTTLDPSECVRRELALVKLHVKGPEERSSIMDYTNIFRGRIIDVAPNSVIVEITGTPDKMNAFVDLTSRFGILEIARTGITALSRGPESVTTDDNGDVKW